MTWHEAVVWMLAVVCAVGWWDAARGWRRARDRATRALDGWERYVSASTRDIDLCAEKIERLTQEADRLRAAARQGEP